MTMGSIRSVARSIGDDMQLASDPNRATTASAGWCWRTIGLPSRLWERLVHWLRHSPSGLVALALVSAGIYGIVSWSVAQRRRELGIRMALGALGTDILMLVIRQGMTPVAYGVGAGLLLSAALTWVLVSLPLDTQVLYGVSATDPVTFGGVTLLLGLVALAACWLPARRAVAVDPMVTLRDGA